MLQVFVWRIGGFRIWEEVSQNMALLVEYCQGVICCHLSTSVSQQNAHYIYCIFFKQNQLICKLRSDDTLLARKEPHENKLHIHLHNCSINIKSTKSIKIIETSYIFSLYNELVHFLNRLTKHKRPLAFKKRLAKVSRSYQEYHLTGV